MPPLLPWLASLLARMLARTWRIEVVGNDRVQQLRGAGVPIVFTVWHAHLLAPLWHRRGEGVALLVSGHANGTYIARAALAWGYRVVRGSSTRGAVSGLRRIIRILSSGCDVAFAPDGPHGPARIPKPGALAVAMRVGAAVIPVGAGASAAWRFTSWDRFSVPRPFARVKVVYGEPFSLSADSMTDGRDVRLAVFKQKLDTAQRLATC